MAKPVDFSGPYLKTERAKHHIDQLESVFQRHLIGNGKALRRNTDRRPRDQTASFGIGLPRHTSTILGDALHNLRASLDHAYCILVEANGHKVHSRTFFPITREGKWEHLKGSVDGHEKTGSGPGQVMIDLIFNEIQPYPGGNGSDLVKLHLLDIADKHTVLLPASQVIQVESVAFKSSGVTIAFENITFKTNNGISVLGPGFVPEESHNQKATFQICFGGGQPYQGEPILPILKELLNRVHETLRLLEQRANEPRLC